MAEGEHCWDAISDDEKIRVWDETERKFSATLRSQKNAENRKIEMYFLHSSIRIWMELSSLAAHKSRLEECRSRLAKELAKVEAELARITNEYEEKANQLGRTQQDYRSSLQTRTENIHGIWFKMRRFFRQKRREDPDAPAMKACLSNSSPSDTPNPPTKRKSLHLTPTTPREDSSLNRCPLPDQIPPSYPTSVPAPLTAPGPQPTFGTHLNKKPKCMPPAQRNPAHD
ncbi:hypothetical protein Focb16_v006054 [Fusarium oxysporum f. sp. cubense]|uniref:Uncharacterized protein n=2 Tax=Fusarium oxysporum f. sp. cubense TaxID=61366 RepID=N4TY08_FUSC1|nr:hypothetical protein FOC1_g10001245 [Fusarium oxysporum f. sp. cubense race 1]TVY73664.1 hypothetical protein Focb16_v006054 [Fusarium oxysporum f. sp. cubense]